MWLFALIPSLVGGLIVTAIVGGFNATTWTETWAVFLGFSFVLYVGIIAAMHGGGGDHGKTDS